MRESVLVHTCCAPCAAYCFRKLTDEGFKITGYFYNPNIHPEKEYRIRLGELIRFSDKENHRLIVESDQAEVWFRAIKGFELEKEGGKRCELCFELRLEKAAKYAKQNGFDAFTTVLTISPHKNSNAINKIGKQTEEKYGIKYLEENFKKQDGFRKSNEISRQYGFYRQNYCGCVYSK